MIDLLRAALLLTCAVNPPAFALGAVEAARARSDGPASTNAHGRRLAGHAGVALGALTALAMAHDPVLRALDVSAPTFQLGAAALLVIAAVQPLLLGRSRIALPGAWMELANPGPLGLAVALAARDGVAFAIAGSVVAVGLASGGAYFAAPVSVDRRWRLSLAVASRGVAALLVLLAFGLGVDALESV